VKGPPMLGTTKSAHAARFGDVDVVVKRARARPTSGLDGPCVQAVLDLELLYLELLRGAAGVPTLYGGWFRDGALSYVVQRAGVPLMRSNGAFHPSWDAAAKSRSVWLMRSILRCFAAFGGAGFYESDLKVHQFAFEPKTLAVYLIDAPRSFRSGLAEFYNKSRPAYQRCDGVRQDYMMTMAYVNAPPATCRHHEACPRVRSSRRTNPEAKGRCENGLCAELSEKSLVYDAGKAPWLFQHILKRASGAQPHSHQRQLGALVDRMTRTRAGERPTFSEVVRSLEALINHWYEE
jgi:hypothetical protein